MSDAPVAPPGFWSTVWILLKAARVRAVGRRAHQRKLWSRRGGGGFLTRGTFGFIVTVATMIVLQALAAFFVTGIVVAGQRAAAEAQGFIVVDSWFVPAIHAVEQREALYPAQRAAYERLIASYCSQEAAAIVRTFGGNELDIVAQLRGAVARRNFEAFVALSADATSLRTMSYTGPIPGMLGSLALLWWLAMLVCQGEGLDLDPQRRRHPMWEWLFSHPVPPGAVFFAEMISPIAANPIYCAAPLLPAILYGEVYGAGVGLLAAFLVGVPVAVAAACLGKAIEIAVMLRFPPRSRGAIVGLMGWFGFSSMMVFFLGGATIKKVATPFVPYIAPLAAVPWPWLGLFLGERADGSFSFLLGVVATGIAAAIIVAGSVSFSIWSTKRGLAGRGDSTVSPRANLAPTRFGRDPLYRKEMLWFRRDRNALVQAVLLPFTLAALQLFNFRGVVAGAATTGWNVLCGGAILFGTYFLFVLGPRSLASEGSALWIALTWPRGLEDLLKAKARLWTLLSSVIVGAVLCYAIYVYPASSWKIVLVGAGWVLFSRSMAEKSVTLAAVTAPSGETEKIPTGRRWATLLGMMTFSIGVLTQQWTIAVMGIVYSVMTAAAMWQNFRAHLPYLYDPWSERLPRPPTLMHAMIAISCLAEGVAVLTGMAQGLLGPNAAAVGRAVSYGGCAVVVSLVLARFLRQRGVTQTEIWQWRGAPNAGQSAGQSGFARAILPVLAGAAIGLGLGLFAQGYLALLHRIPPIADILRDSDAQAAAIPHLHASLFVMGVLFAPPAEEFLFRGLLYRALDREWGGWRAVAGSALFFAIYHPALAWLPVALVGAANALLFKRTGQLAPAVALHMAYNALVLS